MLLFISPQGSVHEFVQSTAGKLSLKRLIHWGHLRTQNTPKYTHILCQAVALCPGLFELRRLNSVDMLTPGA